MAAESVKPVKDYTPKNHFQSTITSLQESSTTLTATTTNSPSDEHEMNRNGTHTTLSSLQHSLVHEIQYFHSIVVDMFSVGQKHWVVAQLIKTTATSIVHCSSGQQTSQTIQVQKSKINHHQSRETQTQRRRQRIENLLLLTPPDH